MYSPYKLYGLDKPGLKIGVVGLGGLVRARCGGIKRKSVQGGWRGGGAKSQGAASNACVRAHAYKACPYAAAPNCTLQGHMAVKFGVAFGCEVYVISRRWAAQGSWLGALLWTSQGNNPLHARTFMHTHTHTHTHTAHAHEHTSRAKEDAALKLGAKALISTADEEDLKAHANSLDGIIDTVRVCWGGCSAPAHISSSAACKSCFCCRNPKAGAFCTRLPPPRACVHLHRWRRSTTSRRCLACSGPRPPSAWSARRPATCRSPGSLSS